MTSTTGTVLGVATLGRVAEPCLVCLTGRTIHDECAHLAICWVSQGRYDIHTVSSVVRALAPTCYLCGAAPSEHAEHVQPLARGGLDDWGNAGGACATCNAVKGHRVITLTVDQLTRLGAQRAAFRAAYNRVTPELIVEALATRARRRAAPTGDPEGDQDDALFRMRLLLFDGTGVSPDDGGSWLEAAVRLMQSRGWLKPVPGWPVPEAVADHLRFQREDDPDGWRYEGGMATRRVPGAL